MYNFKLLTKYIQSEQQIFYQNDKHMLSIQWIFFIWTKITVGLVLSYIVILILCQFNVQF